MAQWNPFEELATLRQEVDRAFEGFGTGQVHCVRSPSFQEEAQDDIR